MDDTIIGGGVTLTIKRPCNRAILERSLLKVDATVVRLRGAGSAPDPLNSYLKEKFVGKAKHIPQIFARASVEHRRQLLAGLIDGAGHHVPSGFGFSQNQHNERLFHDTVAVARSLGLGNLLPTTRPHTQFGKTVQMLEVTFNGAGQELIPVLLPKQKAAAHCESGAQRFTVTRVANAPWYGVTLTGNQRFLLANFTVTHNSRYGEPHTRSKRSRHCRASPALRRAALIACCSFVSLRRADMTASFGV